MDSDLVSAIRSLLELGFPGVMLILNYVLWRQYIRCTNEHLDDLRSIAGMRSNLHAVQASVSQYRIREPPLPQSQVGVSDT